MCEKCTIWVKSVDNEKRQLFRAKADWWNDRHLFCITDSPQRSNLSTEGKTAEASDIVLHISIPRAKLLYYAAGFMWSEPLK